MNVLSVCAVYTTRRGVVSFLPSFLPALVLCFCLFLPSHLQAQAFPCNIEGNAPSCDAPWIRDSTTVQIPSCGTGCEVTVVYSHRTCFRDNQALKRQDIDIQQMSASGGCTQCSLIDLQAHAFEGVMKKNKMGFYPVNAGCSEDMRLMSGQCFRAYNDTVRDFFGNMTHLIRNLGVCAWGGCCWRSFRLCRDGQNNITISLMTGGFNQSNSQPQLCKLLENRDEYPPDSVCYYNCDWAEHTRFTQSHPKQGDVGSEAQPSGADDRQVSGRLEVYDINGKLCVQQQLEKQQLRLVLHELSTNAALVPGVYSYRLREKEEILSGSFVVVP